MNRIGKTRLIILFAIHDGFLAGWPVSLRGLSRLTGTNIFSVWQHIEALAKEGLISRERGLAGDVSAGTMRPEFRFIPYEKLEEEHAIRDD